VNPRTKIYDTPFEIPLGQPNWRVARKLATVEEVATKSAVMHAAMLHTEKVLLIPVKIELYFGNHYPSVRTTPSDYELVAQVVLG